MSETLQELSEKKCEHCKEVGNWGVMMDKRICVSDKCFNRRLFEDTNEFFRQKENPSGKFYRA